MSEIDILCDIMTDHGLCHVQRKALEKVIEEKQQREQGWIPVSEKLPNDSKELVLTITQKNVYWLARYDNDTWIDGAWTSDTGDIIEGEYNDIVTHWMPLPEPVQGGKP